MMTWTNGPVTLHTGHVLDVLRGLPAESVQCVTTSPPYWGLRDYNLEPVVWDDPGGCEHEWIEGSKDGEIWDGGKALSYGGTVQKTRAANPERWSHVHHKYGDCSRCGAWSGSLGLEPTPQLYVQHLVAVFQEVRRVLRSDGTVWLNLGDSYASIGRSERRESPGVGAPQAMSRIDRKLQWKAGGGHNFSWTIPAFGTLLKPKDLVGIPWRVAFALQEDGWWLRSDIIWAKPNPMPESVTDRPTRSHEYLFLLTKAERYFWDQEAVRECGSSGASDQRKMFERLPRIGGKNKTLDDPFNKANKDTHIGQTRAVGSINQNLRSI